MANITQTIPNLTQGISQQPDEYKIPGQVKDMVNTLPDVSQGLLKRPAGKFVGSLSDGSLNSSTDGKWFHYYRDENEQYIGQVHKDGTVRMWNCLTGAEKAVTNAIGNNTYLTHTNDEDIQTLTLNDFTYITNRSVTTEMDTTVEPVGDFGKEIFVELKSISYSKQYALNLFDNTNTSTVTTATRLSVEMYTSSNDYCDANGFMVDHSGRVTNTRCDESAEDGRDAYAPNVGTRIFSLGTNTSLKDDGATGGKKADGNGTSTNYQYNVSVYNSNGQSGQTGRANLYFRIATTGQSVPYTTGSGETQSTTYQARYTTTHDLLHGGEGWQEGDYFFVYMMDARYRVTVETISTSIVQANLALVRPNPTPFDTETTVTAESILGDIRKGITGSATANTGNGFTISQIGTGLHILRSSVFNGSTPVGELLNVVASKVNDIGDLPSQCKHGMVVEVVNSAAEEDNHYVKFFGNNDKDGEGVWEECAKPGRKIRLKYSKMPVALIRVANGSFLLTELDGVTNQVPGNEITSMPISSLTQSTGVVTINNHGFTDNEEVYYFDGGGLAAKLNMSGSAPENQLEDGEKLYIDLIDANSFKLTDSSNGTGYTKFQNAGNNAQYLSNSAATVVAPQWADALVGDDVTNPEPSFIGKTINKMLFFRNRFAFLADENIILSRPGDFYNFFAKSAIQFVASDPIDISASSEYPAILYDGIQVNTGLVLFTKNQQFMLTTDSDVFSIQTAKINSIANYNFNFTTNPISLGTTIGFLDNAGKYSRFYEMANVLREGEAQVIEQSAVVPRLFEKDLRLISNSRENSIIFFSEEGTSTLYGFRYFDQIQERKLASWFKWTVTGTIQYHCVQDDALYVVVRNNNKDQLLKYALKKDSNTLTVDTTNRVHLDHLMSTSGWSYNATTNKSTKAKPTGLESTNQLAAYDVDAGDQLGRYALITINGSNLEITGDWSSQTFLIGYLYTMQVEIPTIYYLSQSGQSWRADTRANTIIHRVKLGFGPVGIYESTLTRKGKTDYTELFEVTPADEYSANTSGIFDDNVLRTIPVYDRNINTSLTIKSTHPAPATLHNMTWEGVYNNNYYQRV